MSRLTLAVLAACLACSPNASAIGDPPTPDQELERVWSELGNLSAPDAKKAISKMSGDPAATIAMLRKQLQPVRFTDEDRTAIARLVKQLGSQGFGDRQKASAELDKKGLRFLPLFREQLQQPLALEAKRRMETLVASLEKMEDAGSRSPERIREIRALQTLEQIATADAVKLLEALAGGSPGARLTMDAKDCLERFAER